MSDTESSGPAIAGRTMARWASFIVLIGSILVIGLLFFRIISAFFVPLFLAALLVVIFRPVHRWVLGRCKQRARLAAGISTAAIFLIVLLPTGLIFTYGILQGIELLSSLHVDDLPDRVVKTRRILGLEMPQPEAIHRTDGLFQEAIDTIKDGRSADPTAADDLIWMVDGITTGLDEKTTRHAHNKLIDTKTALEAAISHRAERFEFDKQMQSAFNHYQEFRSEYLGGPLNRLFLEMANPTKAKRRELQEAGVTWVRNHVLPIGGATASLLARLVIGICITAISLYFFLVDGPAMIATAMRLSPLEDTHEKELLSEFESVSRAVVVATLASALAQAVCAGVGFAIVGLDHILLLTMLTAVFAMIPFVGAAAIWLPSSLWLFFYADRPVAAILLACYGALIVSMIDNLIKPLVLHGQSRLHPLLALLSVLGGVQALGPIGILVGPMIVVFLQTLLKILRRELRSTTT
ncbi:MAG: AI-2E family transporter [Pirellulaceae bacterium]